MAEGRSDGQVWRLWQTEYTAWVFQQDYNYKIEGGESFWDVYQRFVPLVEGWVSTYAGIPDEILSISHGGLYSAMSPVVMKIVTPELVMRYGFAHTSCIVAEPKEGRLVCLEWDGPPVYAAKY
jgi:broad specificity phosphatase PhoE